jgi:lipase chaperone LimK
MDELVMAAGKALVGTMATDAWQQARSAMVSLWRRVHPDHVPAIEAELAAVRTEVLSARKSGDEQAVDALSADWQRRLRRLLQDNPELGELLQQVLDEDLTPLLPAVDQRRIGTIEMRASASGHGRVYQAGGDQTINEK